MRTCALLVVIGVLMTLPAGAQQRPPELTGTLSFDVGSESGRVERIAVQIGDGGTGRYKAILAGDPSLPTHAIYRPRDLGPFGGALRLPIVAFGNGGCRNGSGEFRNFLSDIASHGYLVVAIGPAGDAVVAGSEGRLNLTQPRQLLDGVEWAIAENSRQGSEYFGKLDVASVAIMGQSCGTRQALAVSADPRVKTTVLLNGGPGAPATAQTPAAAPAAANATENAINGLARRYAPFAPSFQAVPGTTTPVPTGDAVSLHAPIAFISGGPSDQAHPRAVAGYESTKNVIALHAWQDVGHYPATYRQPNGGAFAVAVNAWLDWHLKHDQAAAKMFVGSDCGLCKDSKWHVQIKEHEEHR
jgi:dienelactone hydrolase